MKRTSPSAKVSLEAQTPRIIAFVLLALLALIALTGCNHDSGNTADVDLTGVYSLVSVNGISLPCDLQHEGADMTIKSGVFTINADGTCTSLMKFSVVGHEDIGREVRATYTHNGTELTMNWERAGTTKGDVDGNRFTMNNEGMLLAYEK